MPLGCERTVERFEERLDGISLDDASLADIASYQRHLNAANDSLTRSDCETEHFAAIESAACTALTAATPDAGAGAVHETALESVCSDDGDTAASAGDCDELVQRYDDVMLTEFERLVEATGETDALALSDRDDFVVSAPAEGDLAALDAEGIEACGGKREWSLALEDPMVEAILSDRPWPDR